MVTGDILLNVVLDLTVQPIGKKRNIKLKAQCVRLSSI